MTYLFNPRFFSSLPLEVVRAEELWGFVLETFGVSLHELVVILCLLLVLIFKLENLLSRPQMPLVPTLYR